MEALQCQHLSERVIFLERNKSGTGIRPANLFFIELIIVLLFFSFSAAVILQIFAAADHRQDMSDVTERAVICSQSVAEAFSVTGDFSEAADIVFGDGTGLFDGYTAEIRLDDEMRPSDSGDIVLLMAQRHIDTAAGRLSCLEFEFRKGEELLFSPVICESYFPDKGGAADE